MYKILNDSSFAVVTSRENNRHLFFQSSDGTLRQAIRYNKTANWNTAFELVVARDSRLYTPMTAIATGNGVWHYSIVL